MNKNINIKIILTLTLLLLWPGIKVNAVKSTLSWDGGHKITYSTTKSGDGANYVCTQYISLECRYQNGALYTDTYENKTCTNLKESNKEGTGAPDSVKTTSRTINIGRITGKNWPVGSYVCKIINTYRIVGTGKRKAADYKDIKNNKTFTTYLETKTKLENQKFEYSKGEELDFYCKSVPDSLKNSDYVNNLKSQPGAVRKEYCENIKNAFYKTVYTKIYSEFPKSSTNGTFQNCCNFIYNTSTTNSSPTTNSSSFKYCDGSNEDGVDEAGEPGSGLKESQYKDHCNKIYNAPDKYTSLWDSTSNCCKIGVRSTSGNGTKGVATTVKEKASGIVNSVKTTQYGVTFDSNYGNGLICADYYSQETKNADGFNICSGNVNSGETKNYPTSSTNMKNSDGYELLGWSTNPNCTKGNVVYYDANKTFKVNSGVAYYACYKELFNAERFTVKDSQADGGSSIPCGSININYCYKKDGTHYCVTKDNRVVYREKLKESYSCESSSDNSKETKKSNGVTIVDNWRYTASSVDGYTCGTALWITDCTNNECNYNKVSLEDKGDVPLDRLYVVDRSILRESSDVAGQECKNGTVNKEKTCGNHNQKRYGNTGSGTYNLCYEAGTTGKDNFNQLLEENYICDTSQGYYFDKTRIESLKDEVCNDYICKMTFNVSCTKGRDALRPTMIVSSGLVTGSGTGTIIAKSNSLISAYYVSSEFLIPTVTSNGWTSLNQYQFEINDYPGVKYFWIMNSEGGISDTVSGAVLDTINTDTTVSKLEFRDDAGVIQIPSNESAYKEKIKDSKYVMLSNDLSKDSNALADGFNPFDMEYKLEVTSPTITVYATLTSKDSKYVEGYEPRTVNLKYGINTVLIRIQNKEGKIRTYTILVTRKDDRTSDNTLNNIELSEGNITFNSNVTDYKIEISKKTKEVEVSAEITSDKASYVEGYEPGTVVVKGDTTVKLIKVMSETGSTRTYVITFVKAGTDIITEESLQLSYVSATNMYLPFESKVSNYSSSVEYETDLIDINPVLKDKGSYYDIYIKRNGESDYELVSNKGISLNVGENFIEIRVNNAIGDTSYYRFTIIRKEYGLEISNNTSLKELKVLGYDIKFKPTKKEYVVRIKQEKSLVITAVPESNRSEVFIRGNEELTGFSTVRVKVVAENGEETTYSIDIKKDAFNKTIEIASIILGTVIIIVSSAIIIIKKKNIAREEYYEE